jgi:sugar phosphate isomerase/epimerase
MIYDFRLMIVGGTGEHEMSRQMKAGMLLLVVGACVGVAGVAGAQTKDKWRLGAQSYSFNRFTFEEAMAKTKACGMKYIEVFPDQKIGKAFGDTVFKDMNAEQRQAVKQMLKDAGLTLTCYGVVTPGSEQEWRKLFDFAKDMGFETIVSEPPEEAFGMLDKLCEEYKIGIAIHNHPKPSHYWNYETVLKACEGHSKWIGACADTGHWTRSGIDPLVAIKALGKAGRVRSLHFKDLNKVGPDAHDVPWGGGVSKAREILAELAAEGFEGPFSAEYEYHWDNSVPEIKQSAEWFKKTAAELSRTPARDVFQKDLSNAVMPPNGWAFDAEGVLAPAGGGHGDIWTKERYGNFILELDWKIPEKGNSGVFIRTGSIENWINTAIEVQIHATTDGTLHGQCGAIYDCLSPSKTSIRKPGEWNHYVITCLDNKIYVNLNGEDIIDMDLDQWTEPHKNPDGTKNKFPTAYKDMPREGHLGFQYHGNPVWFKNLKVKPLD